MFQTKSVEKIETRFMLNNFFSQIVPFEIMRKYCRVGQGTDDSMARAHYVLDT